MTKGIATFEVRNNDVSFRVSCQNYAFHLKAALKNLMKDDNESPVFSQYSTDQENVSFLFDDILISEKAFVKLAVFFENTDYPMRVIPLHKGVTIRRMDIAGHSSGSAAEITDEGSLLYGMINFRNQVGKTDFRIYYSENGIDKILSFRTEVLSYKLDYRTDLKSIIKDIEEEYSMLSYSFLKQTYLSFRDKDGTNTDLIWWQIFSQHFQKIINAVKTIINSPKKRLKSEMRYERAERLKNISSNSENEYSIFKNDPHHLYRTENLFLSNDTIENRFLKYAVKEMHRRFSVIREHIKYSLKVSDAVISEELSLMDEQLLRICNHPFFHQIGQFKGFTQDSLVMKRARGYSDIYKEWLLLQCGYELEESINNIEVKDISDLYEIWCFIKIKNMVHKIIGDNAIVKTSGKELTSSFIKQLVYGSQSEVTFYKGDIELATITYNAQVEKEEEDIISSIADTSTFTTIQRPDIVLRLSKRNDEDIVYTYLFDAKYRLSDRQIERNDVPPSDAINQMHRYRDAIYYTGNDGAKDLKKEIIGGYILYPGNLTREDFDNSYYHRSAKRIGIGAFPLKPGSTRIDLDGNLYIDPSSSEILLFDELKKWIENKNRKDDLLKKSIPQRGLFYTDKIFTNVLLVSVLPTDIPAPNISQLKSGTASFYMLTPNFPVDIDLNSVKYFAPVYKRDPKYFYGYYKVDGIFPRQIKYNNSYHINIELRLSEFKSVSGNLIQGILGDYKQMTVSMIEFDKMLNFGFDNK